MFEQLCLSFKINIQSVAIVTMFFQAKKQGKKIFLPNWRFSKKSFPQVGHAHRFSFRCTREMWLFRFISVENIFPQVVQRGTSSSAECWARMCARSDLAAAKMLGQC